MSDSGLNVIPIQEQNEREEEGKDTIQQTEKQQKKGELQKEESDEEEEEEEQKYQISKMLPKQNQKEKLIQQNIKLKTQIYQLATQLDQILMKDKINRKKKYGVGAEEEDQRIRDKKLQLKKQQLQVMETKSKIFVLKRELDSVYNNQIIQEKEDRLNHLKLQLKQVEEEKDGLLKVQKGQTKALKSLKNQKQYKDKIDKTHRQVQRIKEQTKGLVERALQAQKTQIKYHDSYVMKKQKVRQLEQKLALNKQKGNAKEKHKGKKPSQTITNELVEEMQEEVRKLEIQKKKGEKVWQDKIRLIDGELQSKRQEQQRKLQIIREKEKELKLNEIRIKQLRKMVKQNIISQNTKKSQEVDMKKFRYQRNIKQMQR